jgi:hypothetical protein
VVRDHPAAQQSEPMTTSDICHRLVVAGHLFQTVTQLIDRRFGSAALIGRSGLGSAVYLIADRPALRPC